MDRNDERATYESTPAFLEKKRCVERSAEKAVQEAYPGKFGAGSVRAEGPHHDDPDFWIIWARNSDPRDVDRKYCIWEFKISDKTLHGMYGGIADEESLEKAIAAKRAGVSDRPAEPAPVKLSKDAFLAMPYLEKVRTTLDIAAKALARSGLAAYDSGTVAVEPQSAYHHDWYLWTMYARVKDGVSGHGKYAAWTLNLEDKGISGGYYDLPDEQSLNEVLCRKRS